eukprot:1139347-Pelagomonas_calceolata.AAC.6
MRVLSPLRRGDNEVKRSNRLVRILRFVGSNQLQMYDKPCLLPKKAKEAISSGLDCDKQLKQEQSSLLWRT